MKMKREFTRKEYEKVKKMDRREMEQYIQSKYEEGLKDGEENSFNEEVLINNLFAKLLTGGCKGVGPTTVNNIVEFAKENGISAASIVEIIESSKDKDFKKNK